MTRVFFAKKNLKKAKVAKFWYDEQKSLSQASLQNLLSGAYTVNVTDVNFNSLPFVESNNYSVST